MVEEVKEVVAEQRGSRSEFYRCSMNELSESFLKETYQAMEELDQVSVKKFDSIHELFDALDND
ncbi:MAG TPA: hypothetical protein PKK11_05160 [Methanothrix sp.]|nr:hypothetical protein [Methanothrix sp.]